MQTPGVPDDDAAGGSEVEDEDDAEGDGRATLVDEDGEDDDVCSERDRDAVSS